MVRFARKLMIDPGLYFDHTPEMLRSIAPILLQLALASVAPADVIYTYTGEPFSSIIGNWAAVFGSTPTQITATVDVPNPFPQPQSPSGGVCGSVGNPTVSGFYSGVLPPGIVSASIGDGVRTITPDFVYLQGCGTTIMDWTVAGGSYLFQASSDDRAISTSYGRFGGAADSSIFVQEITTPTYQVNEYQAFSRQVGQWTAIVTPEINTGCLALISGSLLLFGYWRRKPWKH